MIDGRQARRAGTRAARASSRPPACRTRPELYGVAMRICRDPDTAKDLVQETLLRAMVAWSSFEPGSNLRAWLFRILTNSFINGYRKRRRHQRFATERPGDALIALYGRDQDHTDDLEDDALRRRARRRGPGCARQARCRLPRRRRARRPQGPEVQGHRRRARRSDRHRDVAPVPRAPRARDRARRRTPRRTTASSAPPELALSTRLRGLAGPHVRLARCPARRARC